MLKKFHMYHMVSMSPWPLFASLIGMVTMINLNFFLFNNFNTTMMMYMALTMLISFMWWKDVYREVSYEGLHHFMVIKGLKFGMILFILSEIMFFFSFFWAFFHYSLSPNIEMGQSWPPLMIESFNPINVPLLNTIILISSGVSVTWAHHSLLKNNFKMTNTALLITWMLGIYFTLLQYLEYHQSMFNMTDSSYGNIFFIATGFHGLHVILGTIFLMATNFMLYNYSSNKTHFLAMDLSAWYWHFVDVVWLFLYIFIYWWSK